MPRPGRRAARPTPRRPRRSSLGGSRGRARGRGGRADAAAGASSRRAPPAVSAYAVRPRGRHRLAPHVLLRADPGRGAAHRAGVDSEPEVTGTVDEEPSREDVDRRRPVRRARGRRRRPALADGRPARPARRSAPWCTACWSTPTRRPPDLRGRAAAARRASSGAGGRSTPAPTTLAEALLPMQQHPARPAGRRPHAGRHPAARPAARARLRVPAGRWRRGPRGAGAAASDGRRAAPPPAAPTTRCGPTPTGSSRPALGDQALRGYLSGSIDVVLRRRRPDPASATSSSTTRPTGSATPGGRSPRSTTRPPAIDRGDAALPLPAAGAALLRRAAPLPALAAAGLRPRAAPRRHPLPLRPRACAGPRPPRSTGSPAASSPGSRRRPWSWSCPTCSTAAGPGRRRWLAMIEDPRDRRLALGATGLLRALQPRRGAAPPPTSTSPPGSARCSARPTSDVLLAVALAVRAVRHGSVCLDLATRRRAAARATTTSAARGPSPAAWAAAVAASPLVARAGARACDGRPALPRPLLARGGPGLRRPRRPAAPRRRPRSTRRSWTPGVRPGLPRRRATPSSARPRARRATRWTTVLTGGPGHRQDHHGGRAAGPGGRAARGRRRPPAADGAERARPARPRPGCRRPCRRRPGGSDPVDRDRLGEPARLHAAPAARLAPRQQRPVPPPPRQPAAPRRRRGRRDLDGLADDDGAAARGGAPRRSARPGRRPRPARLGRGRRGAGRPRRRACEGIADSPVAALRTTHRFGARIGALAEALRDGDADARHGRAARRVGGRRAGRPRGRRGR